MTLTISHYIYLTKEQRYSLHAGNTVNTIGVSVPVWFQKGNTSEPAKEIFCRYEITNKNENNPVVITKEGYLFNLPHQDISATVKEQELIDISSRLLDIEDSGSEHLEFRQYGKVSINDKEFNVIHFFEIKTTQILEETLS